MKKLVAYLRGFMPVILPSGDKEFDNFCLKIFKTYGLPDMRSYREAVATMIMHLSPTTHKVSLYYFGRSIKKAQANQVAYHKIQEFKKAYQAEEEEKARIAEAEAANEKVEGMTRDLIQEEVGTPEVMAH